MILCASEFCPIRAITNAALDLSSLESLSFMASATVLLASVDSPTRASWVAWVNNIPAAAPFRFDSSTMFTAWRVRWRASVSLPSKK